ncbi:MAG: HNH endonuclease [Wendovervirus sonii]|uniref:HNH endonuclease n=1 Tax=phage Lak_Megaphage_Sonny TaxID=3109229 RepID=A0ABZ0Z667_9CAUD|nr:MAG: HNH endonuclease [phage Lak_Megaphage_Sonny]
MSIYSNVYDENATKEDIRRANERLANSGKYYQDDTYNHGQYISTNTDFNSEKLRLEDFDELELYNKKVGKVIRIQPKNLYQFVINARANILKRKEFQFLKKIPMFNKDIIFSLYKDTAWTDGCRLFVNPLFAHILSQSGAHKSKNYSESEEGKDFIKNNKEDEITEKINDIQFSLIEFVLLHEVYHVIYEHIKRAHIKIKNPTQKEWDKSNICADLEINRDIVSYFYDEYCGVPEDLNFIWWQQEEFYNKNTNKPFSKECFETIYDNIKDECTNLIKDDTDFSQGRPEAEEISEDDLTELQKIYDTGYRYAIGKIIEGDIDPLNF